MNGLSSVNMISFRGSGSETAGSIAYRNNSLEQSPAFRGSGSETAGSIAYRNNSLEKSQSPNFKGQGAYYLENETKKSPSMMGILLGGLTIGALAIGGLGYAHKTGFFQKAEWLKKLEPAGENAINGVER